MFTIGLLDLYCGALPSKRKIGRLWNGCTQTKMRAIGISNFLQHHLEDVKPDAKIAPMVNQMESHPYLIQQSLLDFCK